MSARMGLRQPPLQPLWMGEPRVKKLWFWPGSKKYKRTIHESDRTSGQDPARLGDLQPRGSSHALVHLVARQRSPVGGGDPAPAERTGRTAGAGRLRARKPHGAGHLAALRY